MAWHGGPEVNILIKATDQATDTLKKVGLSAEDLGRKLITSFSGVVTAGFSLYTLYDNLGKSQYQLARASNLVEDAERAQKNALDKLNEAIAKHGAGSQEAAKVQEFYKAKCDDLALAQERLSLRQNDFNETVIRTAAFAVPSLITVLDRGADAYKTLKTAIDEAKLSQDAFKTSLVSVGEIGLAVGATYLTMKGYASLLSDETKELIQDMGTLAKNLDWSNEQLRFTQLYVTGSISAQEKLGEALDDNVMGLTDYASKWDDVRATVAEASEGHYSFAVALGVSEKEVESLAERLGMTIGELEAFVVQTGMSAEELEAFAAETETLAKQMDTIKDSFFDVFTEESAGFQADLQAMGQTVFDVMSGMEPDFTSVNNLIQEFADRWGLSWDEAEKVVMEKVESIKGSLGEIPKTMEEQLLQRCQEHLDKFREIEGGKVVATAEEMRDAIATMATDINDLIAAGLLGQAQAQLDVFKEAEPDKMWTMVENIDAAIESLTQEMNNEFEKMLALADTLSGQERDLMIQRAEELKAGYLAQIEALENMRSMILTRMQLETQGYTEAEIDTIMSGLATIQSLSGAKWNEIITIWETYLEEAKGDVRAAIAAMQSYIDSLKGKTVYVNVVTRYTEERIPYYVSPPREGGTTTTTQAPYKAPPSLPPSIRQMGLEYVPYTGYLAMLHRGEAILSEREAETWRRGRSRGGDININIANVALASDMDIRETARKLARYVAQEERRLGID